MRVGLLSLKTRTLIQAIELVLINYLYIHWALLASHTFIHCIIMGSHYCCKRHSVICESRCMLIMGIVSPSQANIWAAL